jgi:hypothetical protein
VTPHASAARPKCFSRAKARRNSSFSSNGRPDFSQKEQVWRPNWQTTHRLNYSIKTTSSENTRTGTILIENIYRTICEWGLQGLIQWRFFCSLEGEK